MGQNARLRFPMGSVKTTNSSLIRIFFYLITIALIGRGMFQELKSKSGLASKLVKGAESKGSPQVAFVSKRNDQKED